MYIEYYNRIIYYCQGNFMILFNRKQENKIIELYTHNVSMLNISKIFDTSITPIGRILKKHNIPIKKIQKYTFDTTIFNRINTRAKSYWLGFLIADGNVCGSSLKIDLHKKDYNHLNKFKKFMKSTHPIGPERKNCHPFAVHSIKFIKTLKKHNLVPNKSLITITPKTIPNHLLSHFYRGIFDGDGWITSRKQYRQKKCKLYYIDKKTYSFGFSSGSKIFINQIHQWFCQEIKQKRGCIVHRNQNNHSCYQLVFYGNEVFIKISKILYKKTNQNIRLNRKYEKTKEALIDIPKKPIY